MNTETWIKAFVAVVGLGGLLFGILEFLQVQSIEAARPYLERKLAWCEEAIETTSRIATSESASPKDIARFWQMYWGVMGLIENSPVTEAMVGFGAGLEPSGTPATNLRSRSLQLAHACREELSREWSPRWSRSN